MAKEKSKRLTSKYRGIDKVLKCADSAMLRRVYSLNATGTYSADETLRYLMNYVERLGKLRDQRGDFEDERQRAIDEVWRMVGDVQRQTNNSVAWNDPNNPIFIEDSATLKQALGLSAGGVFEDEVNNRDSGSGTSDRTDRWLKARHQQLYGGWSDDEIYGDEKGEEWQ